MKKNNNKNSINNNNNTSNNSYKSINNNHCYSLKPHPEICRGIFCRGFEYQPSLTPWPYQTLTARDQLVVIGFNQTSYCLDVTNISVPPLQFFIYLSYQALLV
ncbi:hypothetical protein PoB_007500100 [Plakobranchus ocellatus]|uniref:Uncharacterized protein n=1 Tax=Plakobranchus ocellatus TaxID=259542 RepID=A0AAV4DXE0_9GAST|nr:hypothetical protein PoB_007500100 [Plakobranchus ocellatus]